MTRGGRNGRLCRLLRDSRSGLDPLLQLSEKPLGVVALLFEELLEDLAAVVLRISPVGFDRLELRHKRLHQVMGAIVGRARRPARRFHGFLLSSGRRASVRAPNVANVRDAPALAGWWQSARAQRAFGTG